MKEYNLNQEGKWKYTEIYKALIDAWMIEFYLQIWIPRSKMIGKIVKVKKQEKKRQERLRKDVERREAERQRERQQNDVESEDDQRAEPDIIPPIPTTPTRSGQKRIINTPSPRTKKKKPRPGNSRPKTPSPKIPSRKRTQDDRESPFINRKMLFASQQILQPDTEDNPLFQTNLTHELFNLTSSENLHLYLESESFFETNYNENTANPFLVESSQSSTTPHTNEINKRRKKTSQLFFEESGG